MSQGAIIDPVGKKNVYTFTTKLFLEEESKLGRDTCEENDVYIG